MNSSHGRCLIPRYEFMVYISWSEFLKKWFTKPLGPSLGVNRMWIKRNDRAPKNNRDEFIFWIYARRSRFWERKKEKKGVTRGIEGISISTMVGWERYEEFCRGQCRFVISRRWGSSTPRRMYLRSFHPIFLYRIHFPITDANSLC